MGRTARRKTRKRRLAEGAPAEKAASRGQREPGPATRRTWSLGAGALLIVMATYLGALAAGFVFDDHLFLQQECWQIESLGELLGVPFAPSCSYRRVRYVSLALDHLIWRRDPFGYHLTNLVLHGLVFVLVIRLLRRLELSPLPAVVAALLWALHPVQTDVVTYVAGRRDLLTTLFFLLGLLVWPSEWRGGGWKVGRVGLVVGLFALAFMSKEMAVTLPAIILLFELFREPLVAARRGETISSPWRRIGPLLRRHLFTWALLATVTALAIVYRVFIRSATSHPLAGGDWGHHLLTIPANYTKLLELVVFPMRLYGDYSDYPPATGLGDLRVWVGLGVLAAVWIGGAGQAKKRPYLAFGLLWFGITMLPVSQLVPHHERLAEHYLYLPLVGLAVALGRGIELLWERARARAVVAVAVAGVAGLYIARDVDRNADFESQRSFAEALLTYVPDSMRGHSVLASAQYLDGDYDEARVNLRWLIERSEPGSEYHHGPMKNLLSMLFNSGDLERAETLAEQMMTFYPEDPHPYRVLGAIRADQERLDEALVLLQQAYERDPDNLDGRLHLGVTLRDLGRLDEAEEHISYVAAHRRHHAESQLHWALLAVEQGDAEAATERFEWLLELEPDNLWALDGLSQLAWRRGDVGAACEYLRRLREHTEVSRPEWGCAE